MNEMVDKICKIGISTDDVESAVRFYTETLDLEVIERFEIQDDDDYVFMKAGDVILELMPAKSTGQPPGFHHISFVVNDIEKETKKLIETGATIRTGPIDTGDSSIHFTAFEGPDNLNLQLFERRS